MNRKQRDKNRNNAKFRAQFFMVCSKASTPGQVPKVGFRFVAMDEIEINAPGRQAVSIDDIKKLITP